MEEKKLFKVSSNPLVRTKRDTTSIMLDVIIALDRWLVQRAEVDECLSPEMLESITSFHRKYIEYITSNET